MKVISESLEVRTSGKGTYEITGRVARVVRNARVETGLVIFEHREAPHARNVVVTVLGAD